MNQLFGVYLGIWMDIYLDDIYLDDIAVYDDGLEELVELV